MPCQEEASCEPGRPSVPGLGIPSLWGGSLELCTPASGACASRLCGLIKAMLRSGPKEPSSPSREGSEEHWPSRGPTWKWHSASPDFTACWLPEMENKNSVRIPVCERSMSPGEGAVTVTCGGLGTQLPRSSTSRDISLWFYFMAESLMRLC